MKTKLSLVEWLGFRAKPDFQNAKRIGRVIGFAISVLAIVFVTFFLIIMGRIGMALLSHMPSNPPDEAIRNLGLAIAALIGLPFLVWRSIVAQQQVRVSEQGMITDRINKAVEGLGAVKTVRRHRHSKSGKPLFHWHPDKDENGKSKRDEKNPIIEEITEPNLEVRSGAIYSLERIANDSPRDHIAVMEILCAYVRGNAAYSEFKSSSVMPEKRPRTDIQAAISVLARRQDWQIKLEASKKFRLDLSFSDLTGVDFKQGNFSGALFSKCILERADFQNCALIGARFEQAQLNYSTFFSANLRGARWWQVRFDQGESLSLMQTTIEGMDLGGANIPILDFLASSAPPTGDENYMQRKTFGDSDTILSHVFNLSQKYRETIRHRKNESFLNLVRASSYRADKCDTAGPPFLFWSHKGHLSYETAWLRSEFHKVMGLTGWPYDDD